MIIRSPCSSRERQILNTLSATEPSAACSFSERMALFLTYLVCP
jgi:hypothetical protein